MRETITSGSVGRAPGNRCLYPEGDGVQRPLRSRFQRRLSTSVDMTSNVKGGQQIFLGLHDFSPRGIGRVGASNMRRLILLISVGWVPPYLSPSGACLTLGASILSKPPNAAEDDTTPGLRLCRCPVEPFRVAWS
jgi:hypothetical protein